MTNQNNTTPVAKSVGRTFRNDLILIVALVLFLAVLGTVFFFSRAEGDTVVVTIDKKTFGTYPLSEDVTVDIVTGEQGEHLTRLVIRDGRACMATASCPDGICAEHKPIHRNGESIVCLPNRVVVTVRTAEKADEPDIII